MGKWRYSVERPTPAAAAMRCMEALAPGANWLAAAARMRSRLRRASVRAGTAAPSGSAGPSPMSGAK